MRSATQQYCNTVKYGCVSLRMRFFSQNFGMIKRILPGSSSLSHCEGPGVEVAHSFDLFDAAATRRNTRAPMAAMLLAIAARIIGNCISWECIYCKKSIFFLILPFIVSFVVRISKLKVRRVLF